MSYVDGFILAVPKANKAQYQKMAAMAWPLFKEFGALRHVEAWADDVPDGTVTDFKGAVKARDDETVVYSWVEWPSKEARIEGWKKVMEDERMKPDGSKTPFDGQRMVYGGFAPLLDE